MTRIGTPETFTDDFQVRRNTIMKADTFAKLVVLETLVDAEIGHYLEEHPPSMELFREGLVARVSDLVDQIDALDAVAAARVYDALVDFLAELPENDEGVVETTLKFRRAMDRLVERGMDSRELAQASTWAIVLDELLEELADDYHDAIRADGEVWSRAFLRAQTLLSRARESADRVLRASGGKDPELRNEIDRLTFAVRHQRLKPQTVDVQIRSLQKKTSRYRPSTITRIGAFVLGQVLRRDHRRKGGKRSRGGGSGEPQTTEGG